ncbi:hypothetical protein WMZ97_18785 [Lentibacillus sp. N15]|uniref:hypothetical protein n=1 Tax=Lentibacillus songyuanensis TaxID=3136161 RepID=UPI0031B9F3A8
MNLQNLMDYVNQKEVNKFFIFYKDKEGKTDNICFQDYIFFRIEKNKKVRFLNPLRVADTLAKVKRRELTLVGAGHYVRAVNFDKQYNWKGKIKSWKIS